MAGASTLCSVGAAAGLCVAYLLLHQEEDAADVRPGRRAGRLFLQVVARLLLLVVAGCIAGIWLTK